MPNINVHKVYMNIAVEIANLSYCVRKKVGAIIVKDNSIISYGYNGTPVAFDNCCELELDGNLVSKREILHAESNSITKVAKSTNSTEDSKLFVTLSPCYECAKLIIQSGITEVYYKEIYRETDGIDLLRKAGIPTSQIS